MIRLDYKLSSNWNSRMREVDLAVVDEGALRYEILLGDIIFEVDNCDFSALWGWVPLIDFGASLREISSEIQAGKTGDETFEFTESEATLRFQRTNNRVKISASYVPCLAEVPIAEFALVVDAFWRRLMSTIEKEYPSLFRNEELQRLIPKETGKDPLESEGHK